jgi:hypothetical protein
MSSCFSFFATKCVVSASRTSPIFSSCSLGCTRVKWGIRSVGRPHYNSWWTGSSGYVFFQISYFWSTLACESLRANLRTQTAHWKCRLARLCLLLHSPPVVDCGQILFRVFGRDNQTRPETGTLLPFCKFKQGTLLHSVEWRCERGQPAAKHFANCRRNGGDQVRIPPSWIFSIHEASCQNRPTSCIIQVLLPAVS